MLSDQKRTCRECFKLCRPAPCFEPHKKSRKWKGVSVPSKCETSFKCQTCSVPTRKQQSVHKCGDNVCHYVSIMCCLTTCVACNRNCLKNQTVYMLLPVWRSGWGKTVPELLKTARTRRGSGPFSRASAQFFPIWTDFAGK